MPSFITHAFVGAAAGALITTTETPKRFLFFAVICSMLPDADLIGYEYGVFFDEFFGHNGFFHSIVFSLGMGFIISFIFFRINGFLSAEWWKYFVFFFLIIAIHGMLDAMIRHGEGAALLAPYDETRRSLPWTPLEPAPLGIFEFFGPAGWKALKSEFIYIWAPLGGLLILVKGIIFLKKKIA